MAIKTKRSDCGFSKQTRLIYEIREGQELPLHTLSSVNVEKGKFLELTELLVL